MWRMCHGVGQSAFDYVVEITTLDEILRLQTEYRVNAGRQCGGQWDGGSAQVIICLSPRLPGEFVVRNLANRGRVYSTSHEPEVMKSSSSV
jgi:hypothetical protein